jgi:alpha-L-fucosidase
MIPNNLSIINLTAGRRFHLIKPMTMPPARFRAPFALAALALALTATGWVSPVPVQAQGNQASQIAEGGNATSGYDMAPETRPEVVLAALNAITNAMAPGPFQPTWDSLKANYQVPQWFLGAKFGLFMHWGLYSVPAHHNEWYEKHMYAADAQWHAEHFGPQDKFGYKDFIPLFTCEKFNADEWAELFKKSGARFVVPTAQHHDGFSLWDSDVNPVNAKNMGPRRDLIGELCQAVRKQGLKFGVSNHGIENFQFINPTPALTAKLKSEQADLYDPKWANFYNVADRSDAACERFLVNWYERNVELIDKYQPDMLWFDNGVDIRYLDPLKLKVAAYYYNRAKEWGKEVSISTKKAAYAPSGKNTETIGSILDFEKIGGRSPAGIRTGSWQVDEPIGSTWGYTADMRISGPAPIISKLVDTVSKNGTLLLNLSPKSDGTFAPEIHTTLLEVGQWLGVNGEAIYDTHAWIKFADGAGARGARGSSIHFTVNGDSLYAIIGGAWPAGSVTINSLGSNAGLTGRVTGVKLLGGADCAFIQGADGLKVSLPATAPGKYAYTLKISGLQMNPSTYTTSGNPL